MGGVLLMLALIGGVFAVLIAVYRRRAQSAFDRAAATLPPELAARINLPKAAEARAAAPTRAVAPAVAPRLARASAHFMLNYEVGPDFTQRREQYRDEHLALAWKAAAAGELLLAGALEEGSGRAMLLFRDSRAAAERFAQADPYVRNGLITRWSVQQWLTTVGEAASSPVRPGSARLTSPPVARL